MLHVLFVDLISRSDDIDRKSQCRDASLHRIIGFSYSNLTLKTSYPQSADSMKDRRPLAPEVVHAPWWDGRGTYEFRNKYNERETNHMVVFI